MRSLRRYFLEGLALAGPVGLTAFVLVWIFRNLDGILGRFLYPALGSYALPGIGVVGLVVLLVATGWVAEKVVGARLMAKWDELLRKVPVARRVYSGSSRIFRTVLGEERVTIYMPTAPNPVSGYLLILPRSRVSPMDVTVEEAFTYVVSAGAVSLSQAQTVLAGAEGSSPPSEKGGAS